MSLIDLIEYFFYLSLTLLFISIIASLIFHKVKNIKGYNVVEKDKVLTISRNQLTVIFESLHRFFFAMIFSIFIIYINNLSLAQLAILMLILLATIISLLYFKKETNHNLVIDSEMRTISFNKQTYHLNDVSITVKKKYFNPSISADLYGLFLQSPNFKPKLVYGYSLLNEIDELRQKIEAKKNSH